MKISMVPIQNLTLDKDQQVTLNLLKETTLWAAKEASDQLGHPPHVNTFYLSIGDEGDVFCVNLTPLYQEGVPLEVVLEFLGEFTEKIEEAEEEINFVFLATTINLSLPQEDALSPLKEKMIGRLPEKYRNLLSKEDGAEFLHFFFEDKEGVKQSIISMEEVVSCSINKDTIEFMSEVVDFPCPYIGVYDFGESKSEFDC